MSAPQQLRIGEAPPSAPARDNGAASLTEEQAAAIASRDRDVFLVAGAGTGKTRVLVQRYCDSVTEDGVRLDEILAFTFTDKAAGELRARIRAELADRAAAQGDPERAREIWRLARDTDRASIGTIHGFCRRLLAAHPVAAGLDPRFRVLSEGEADLVAERAFEAALDEITAQDPEAEAMAAGYRIPRLRRMVVATYEQLRSQGVAQPTLPEMGDPTPSPKPGANGEAGEADGHGAGPEGADAEPRLTPAEAAAATEAYRCLGELLSAFSRHYERLKQERSALDFEDLELEAVRLLRTSAAVGNAYRARFAHLMVDEFQDTNRLQLELIEQLRGLQTRVFVVGDEFQSIYGFRNADLEVFRAERARAEAEPDERAAVLPLRGNFRARPQIVAAVNALGATLLEDFEPLNPTRPAPGSAAEPAVELLLTEEEGWDAEGVDVGRLIGEGASPARVAEARFLAARLRALADAGVPKGEMVVLLRAFTHVATYEEALERAGLDPYVVGGRGYWSDQQVEDMLRLLACVANPLEDESLFGALACPAVGVRPDALWLLRRSATEDGRPRHVWPLLERRFGPGDRAAGENEEERHRQASEDWAAAIEPDDADRLRGFCDVLGRLREAAPLLSLEELCDRTARAFGYDLAVLMRERGRQRLANVRKLMRLARQFESAEGRDLGAFLRYAEARTARFEREGQAATEAEDHDGVRLMTIHAAKGLEFDTVAVADLARGLLGPGGWVDLRVGPSDDGDEGTPSLGLQLARAGRESIKLWEFERLKQEAAEADSAEELRLVYVAVTRAQERLLLSGTFCDRDLTGGQPTLSASALRRLLPALGFTGGEPELEVEGGRIAVRVNRAAPEAARELTRRRDGATAGAAIAPGGPPPLLPPATDVPAAGHLSYAALADYERCGYRFYVKRVLGMRSPDSTEPEAVTAESDQLVGEADLVAGGAAVGAGERRLRFGTAVHGLLEWSARNRWARPGEERCAALLRHEGLEPTDAEMARALDLVDGWLGSELRASLDDGRVRLRPELPFMLAVGGSVVRGKMDLVAELPDGELLVVDYKTDALGDSGPEAHAERYETQRGVYALAASSAAPNGGGAAAVRTVYCFLERPDRPLERSFGPSELEAARAEIERLVAGVRSGRFEVTDTPHLALCHDCPARERLCIHPIERTMARLGV